MLISHKLSHGKYYASIYISFQTRYTLNIATKTIAGSNSTNTASVIPGINPNCFLATPVLSSVNRR